MNLNSFMPVKLVTGAGCVRKSTKELAKLGKTCLIVTGKTAAKVCGALQDVTETLESNGQKWMLFDGIGQNPKLTDCMAAAEKAVGADFIVGIGGGSALDAAKCIAVLAANPGMTQAQLYAFDWPNPPLKTVAVGTTAGTGSEVTKVSVITTPDGRKKSFHHEAVFPALALGDPTYTMSLPSMVTRATATCTGGQHQFSAKSCHQQASFHAHGVRHNNHTFISPGSCHTAKTDTGISGGWLNNDTAGLQNSLFFRIQNHGQRHTILGRTGRITALQLCQKSCFQSVMGFNMGQLQQRGTPDQLGCRCINMRHKHSSPTICYELYLPPALVSIDIDTLLC